MAPETKAPFTALDWIAVVITATLLVAVGVTPISVSRTFLEMFQSFGDLEELPMVTQIALSTWYGLLTPLLPWGLLVWGVVSRSELSRRRAAVVASFCLVLAILAVYLFGAYAPIFEIADAVGP